ncbi:MAG: hypothetical protein ACQESP_02780 [Candidatus Muiribacteriota bacterium]
MRYFKKSTIFLLALILMTTFTFAEGNPIIRPGDDIQLLIHPILEKNWQVMEKLAENESEGRRHMQVVDQEAEELLEFLIHEYHEGNVELIHNFIDEFEKLDKVSQAFLSENLIKPLIEYERTERIGDIVIERASDYLPGYGYTDPLNYLYKLGREVGSEHLQNFWKEEHREFEENRKYRYYVEMNAASEMEAGAGGNSSIEGFQIKGNAMVEINGEMKEYAEVEFEVKQKVTTTALVMYEKREVEFEVLRADKGFFKWLGNGMSFKWEVDGTCYLVKEFPAQTDEIIPPEQIMNL